MPPSINSVFSVSYYFLLVTVNIIIPKKYWNGMINSAGQKIWQVTFLGSQMCLFSMKCVVWYKSDGPFIQAVVVIFVNL